MEKEERSSKTGGDDSPTPTMHARHPSSSIIAGKCSFPTVDPTALRNTDLSLKDVDLGLAVGLYPFLSLFHLSLSMAVQALKKKKIRPRFLR